VKRLSSSVIGWRAFTPLGPPALKMARPRLPDKSVSPVPKGPVAEGGGDARSFRKGVTMLARICILSLGAALFFTQAAQAQSEDSNPIRWHVMGGFNEPTGSTNDLLNTGYNLGGGVTFHQAASPLAFRLDFGYSRNNASQALIGQANSAGQGLQITGGWAETFSLSGNLELRVPLSPSMFGYLIGGGGVYYNRFSLTEFGYGYVCNPWWGYCYLASGNVVVASNDVTKFGWNAGAGVAFRLGNGSQLFLEGRYTEVQTSPQKFKFIPILIGLRF
jgi:opacity protein-like surface antigen